MSDIEEACRLMNQLSEAAITLVEEHGWSLKDLVAEMQNVVDG